MEQISIREDSGIPVVLPRGRLDALTAPGLASLLDELLKPGHFVVVDLSECVYLSSAGIRVILQAHKKLRAAQGGMYVCGARPEVLHVLEMAGLLKVLQVEGRMPDALDAIRQTDNKLPPSVDWDFQGRRYILERFATTLRRALGWTGPDIAGYDELGMAAGFGVPAEPGVDGPGQADWFVTAGHAAAFLPASAHSLPDYRVSADPARAGVLIGKAVSFGTEPAGIISVGGTGSVTLEELAGSAMVLKDKYFHESPSSILLGIASRDAEDPSFTVLLVQKSGTEMPGQSTPSLFKSLAYEQEGYSMAGMVFSLFEMPPAGAGMPFADFLTAALSLENIGIAGGIRSGAMLTDPLVWVFLPGSLAPAEETRLKIDLPSGNAPGAADRFMIRRLYADSARVSIQPLHGGYSAQTFHVTSYDSQGRRLRPTVLKLSNRALIAREAERCTQYALPYIFNNSASVLGAEFHGDRGALRYNFVGIGGDESRLRWLTHYYQEESIAFLDPLLDKIFLHILKPWYGQPVPSTIYPFRDHDPTVTFFPHIYDTVKELFSVSPDEQHITSGIPGRRMLNPYWYLKHEFKRLSNTGIEYLTGICHGDLNMQNILLDEQMNVYLIDFSETRPRSVVSDFARLEAIFLVDNAPVGSDEDLASYLTFMDAFYREEGLDEVPDAKYEGNHTEQVARNAALALKMRNYAYRSARENPDPLPYWFSLLEWVFPVVCYFGLPFNHKRLAMHISSLLCGRIAEKMEPYPKTE